MIIREYKNEDLDEVSHLFFETVHSVNKNDYTTEQLFAWAESADYMKSKNSDLLKQHTLVAEEGGKIIGFGSITNSGLLDLLFVHKDFLRKGVATAICDALESNFSVITTYASITAKPFFKNRGYTVLKSQEVERRGVKLKNFEMGKIRQMSDNFRI